MSDFEARVADTLVELKDWCARNDVPVTPTCEIDGPAACKALGYDSAHTLNRWSAKGCFPATLRRRIGPKWVYTLESIARYREEECERNART